MIEWVFGKAWNDMKVEDPANYRLLKDFMKNPNAKRTPGDQPFVHFGSEDFFSPYWGYWKKWASKLNVSDYRVKKRLVRSFNDYIERLKALKTRIDGLRFK